MKKESIVIALLLVASCSLGFASKALAGKGGSSSREEELKTISYLNYINQLNLNKQQPAPVQDKPAPTPPPPPPPPP